MALVSRHLNPNRSHALDTFRGLVIAGMIVVNTPGSPITYPTLEHSAWNGWTLTDLVFPCFAFIIGVALPYSLAARRDRTRWPGLSLFDWVTMLLLVLKWGLMLAAQTGSFSHRPDGRLAGYEVFFPVLLALVVVLPQLVRRAAARGGSRTLEILHHGVLLFALGFVWNLDATNLSSFRLFGVLQRLGVAYLAAGLIVLHTRRRGQVAVIAGLLASYWLVMTLVPVPGGSAGNLTETGNLAGWFDWWVLTHAGMYAGGPPPFWDPEGFLGMVPTVATALIGAVAGGWLREEAPLTRKMAWLLAAGVVLVVAGLVLDRWFPINKNLWSPTFVLFTGGVALVLLDACLWLVDHRGVRRSVSPFIVLGTNSILIYLLSLFLRHYIAELPGGMVGGAPVDAWQAGYHHLFASWLSPRNASLAMALSYTAACTAIAALLYRRRIFLKL